MNEELKTLQEWAELDGLVIVDPDGFDRNDTYLMERKFPRFVYDIGIKKSTVRSIDYEGTNTNMSKKHEDLNSKILMMYLAGCGYTLIQKTLGMSSCGKIEKLIASTTIGRVMGEGKIIQAEKHRELTPVMRIMIETFSKELGTYSSLYIQAVLISGMSYDESKTKYSDEDLQRIIDSVSCNTNLKLAIDTSNDSNIETFNVEDDIDLSRCHNCNRSVDPDFICCPYCRNELISANKIVIILTSIIGELKNSYVLDSIVNTLYPIVVRLKNILSEGIDEDISD